MDFEQPLFRFAISGTLIGLYGLVDRLARRAGRDPLRAHARPPRWLGPLVFASVLGFYLTIQPHGGVLIAGFGNAIGIALALASMAMRWRTRRGVAGVRQPELAARALFYLALPLSVGSASGLLVLTLPAAGVSAWWSVREDRLLERTHGGLWRERIASSAHWIPGVW